MAAVEYQVLSAIYRDNNLAWWMDQGITDDYFLVARDPWRYILDHQRRYNALPDAAVLLEKYPDLDVGPAGVGTKEELLDAFRELHVYRELRNELNRIEELSEDNAYEGLASLRSALTKLETVSHHAVGGIDLTRDIERRLVDSKIRRARRGLLGISTGLGPMDEWTGGWQPGDFCVIAGRTGEGKTWLWLYFLAQAFLQGKRILLYSGEMPALLVGYRLDAYLGHFSNLGLLRGRDTLGTDEEPKTFEDYEEYLTRLSTESGQLICVTQQELGGRKLTVPDLERLINIYHPDLVGIDQLSLMDDAEANRRDEIRIRYTRISLGLFNCAIRYQIPILALAQANRASLMGQGSDDNPPDVHHIAESDGIVQNATHVLTLKRVNNGQLKLALRKNRNGLKEQEMLCWWDVDHGLLTPVEEMELPGRMDGIELF